jgi:polysaccharide biosynthesis protein PslH
MTADRRLRVAVIDEELPYPAISGKRIRTLNLIQRLAERHEVSFLCHRNPDPREAAAAIEFFRDHGIRTIVADRAPPPRSTLQGGAKFYARLAANLLSPLPYLVTANCSPQLRQVIARHAAEQPVDVWHCEWTPYVQLTKGLNTDPLVTVAHNVESTIWQRYFENEANPAKRWYIKQQWRKLQEFERWAFARSGRMVAVSDCDAARMRDDFGTSGVDVVENGVDTEFFRPTDARREAGHILFLGSLDWRPNLDAAKLLLEQIFPRVLRSRPGARLLLVGRNPPDWLRQAAAQAPGVELHADVPDVRPFLNRCGLMTVPLRIGGGSRLKILEALACGVPVVSTTVGAEGLMLEKDVDYFVADGVENMAQRLVACIDDPEAALESALRGRAVVLEHYGWDGLANKLEQVWRQVASASPAGLVSV